MKLRTVMTGVLLGAMCLSTACGPVGSGRDDGIFEPKRKRRVKAVARQLCKQLDSCGELGDDGKYDSKSECRSEVESDFYDMWPEDECGDGQIDSDAYEVCYDRAKDYPCDSNVFDLLSTLSSCSALKVCTDPKR